ncbi:MAG TPA: MarR family transcriptional regulator [Acidimicrobiales bacterium]|jgi:DNA-binding MarR family transcriptional regulator|nr:MarR family transcriptional regulator [Acidimicrobiales bacterium]
MDRRTHAQSEITELAGRLRLASARLHRRLRQEADAGLSPSQQSALGTIDLRGPITLGDLAATEQVTPPTITKVIARLEEEGLVDRTVDPSDRRITRVSATPEGRRRLEHSRARRNAFLAVRLEELGPDAVRRLGDAIDALEELAGVGVVRT